MIKDDMTPEVAYYVVRNQAWGTPSARPYLVKIGKTKGIKKIIDKIMNNFGNYTDVDWPKRPVIYEITISELHGLINSNRQCQGLSGLVKIAERSLYRRVLWDLITFCGNNSTVNSLSRKYDQYYRKAKEANVELTDSEIAKWIGKRVAKKDVQEMRQAYQMTRPCRLVNFFRKSREEDPSKRAERLELKGMLNNYWEFHVDDDDIRSGKMI
jgi:hypothetical protein